MAYAHSRHIFEDTLDRAGPLVAPAMPDQIVNIMSCGPARSKRPQRRGVNEPVKAAVYMSSIHKGEVVGN